MDVGKAVSGAMLGMALASGLWAGAAAAAETYTVGVENIEYLPQYSFHDGEYVGFARAVFDAFGKDKGYVFEYRAMPVARLFAEFVAGNVDLKYPDNAMWNAEAKKAINVVYSDPVVAYIDGVSVLPERLGRGADAIKTLGLVRGFTAWDWMDRLKAGTVTAQENNSFNGLLEMTILGRTDGAYANVAVVNYQLETQLKKPGALAYDPNLPHTAGHYHLSTLKHPKLIAEFNAWMKDKADLVAKLKAEHAVEKGVK